MTMHDAPADGQPSSVPSRCACTAPTAGLVVSCDLCDCVNGHVRGLRTTADALADGQACLTPLLCVCAAPAGASAASCSLDDDGTEGQLDLRPNGFATPPEDPAPSVLDVPVSPVQGKRHAASPRPGLLHVLSATFADPRLYIEGSGCSKLEKCACGVAHSWPCSELRLARRQCRRTGVGACDHY